MPLPRRQAPHVQGIITSASKPPADSVCSDAEYKPAAHRLCFKHIMKTSAFFGATLAILGLAAVPTQAQTQSSTTTTTTTNYVQTSKLVGMRVNGSDGQEIGTIKDVVLDRDTGCMAYTVLSTGGGSSARVTGTTKTVAVPWTVYSASSDPTVVTVRVDRERIYNAPQFDYARINEYSTSGYTNNVYSYYGVQPSVGIGVGVSTGATTNTGGYNAQTGIGAQSGASQAASASPSMTPSATATASASASPSATAKARAASGAASSRTSATPSSSASERTGEPSAEETASPTGKGRHHREGTSPAASPSTGTSPGDVSSTSTSSTSEKAEGTASAAGEKASTRGKRRGSESSETNESSTSKSSKSSSSAEASPTP